MTDNEAPPNHERPVWEPEIREIYVAYVDVLGFAQLIENDFEAALDKYSRLIDRIGLFKHDADEVSIRVYSDAMLLASPDLIRLTQSVQSLNMLSLMADCLVRGGIGFGQHTEQMEGGDTLVVSQALTRAVQVEKEVGHPCVALHESVVVPDGMWVNTEDTVVRPILFFEGVRLVNPFGLFWGRSAKFHVEQMRDRHREHADKYNWFLRLFDAVINRDIWSLVPPEYVHAFERVEPTGG